MRAWREPRALRLQRPLHQAALRQVWPRPIQQPHPPIHIPGGGSIETCDFCIDNTYSYSYLSFGGYLRGKALMDGYWKRVAERKRRRPRPTAPASPRSSASPIPTPRPSASTPSTSTTSTTAACTSIPGFADAPGYRTIKTMQEGALPQFTPKRPPRSSRSDLEGAGRERPRHRRHPRDGAPAHGGPDQRSARRQRLLPDAHGRHAQREGAALDALFAEQVMPQLRNVWPE